MKCPKCRDTYISEVYILDRLIYVCACGHEWEEEPRRVIDG